MASQIKLGDIAVDVVLKDIKNVHLSVHPPTGRVRISAPTRMKLDTIRVFAISKLAWIRQQQKKLREQEREAPREYLERESHYVWGKRYLLQVTEGVLSPAVVLAPRRILLSVPRGADRAQRKVILERWYRDLVREQAIDLIQKWRPLVGVDVRQLFPGNSSRHVTAPLHPRRREKVECPRGDPQDGHPRLTPRARAVGRGRARAREAPPGAERRDDRHQDERRPLRRAYT